MDLKNRKSFRKFVWNILVLFYLVALYLLIICSNIDSYKYLILILLVVGMIERIINAIKAFRS